MLKKILRWLRGGWERCNPPEWFDPDREMSKWKGLPRVFYFKGKNFKYKGVIKSSVGDWGSSGNRFLNSYRYYRKKR